MKRRSNKVSAGKDDKGKKVASEGSVLDVTVILRVESVRPRGGIWFARSVQQVFQRANLVTACGQIYSSWDGWLR